MGAEEECGAQASPKERQEGPEVIKQGVTSQAFHLEAASWSCFVEKG